MEILTSVKDILQMARDDSFSGYTAERLIQDFNELSALRAAAEKMKDVLEYIQETEDLWGASIEKSNAAIAEYEALK